MINKVRYFYGMQEDICSSNIQPGEQLSGELWDPLGRLEGVFV
jgi:hypothetical protein